MSFSGIVLGRKAGLGWEHRAGSQQILKLYPHVSYQEKTDLPVPFKAADGTEVVIVFTKERLGGL